MDGKLTALLTDLAEGRLSIAEAAAQIAPREESESGFDNLGFARVDVDRFERQGVPEVVYGEGKSSDEISSIVGALLQAEQSVFVTRVSDEKVRDIHPIYPQLKHNSRARCLSWRNPSWAKLGGRVALVAAGTSDLAVAEEARETLLFRGVDCETFFDVGVAGLHRLLAVLDEIKKNDVVICVAGMEGALSSVLGGLVAQPLISVPTSVGYGAALGGWAALTGMLTACSSGVSVVNIDNGFGAAMAALRILQLRERGA